MVGDVNEEYVQAADGNVIRPRFRWKTLAACAACAALALGAYPAYQAANPPLHDYVVMEGAGVDETLKTDLDEAAKAPAQGGPTADSAPEATMEVNGFSGGYDAGAASIYNEQGKESVRSDVDGTMDRAPTQDIPAQEAALWYDALLKAYRLDENPEWYGGAWLAGERLLAVAIVDGFRTPELEAEIQEATGEGAVLQFSTVKYSQAFLYGLMEPAVRALEDADLRAGVGVDVMDNCLSVDLYSDSDTIPDSVLAALAHLDPDGDAIRVRLFTGKLDALTDAPADAVPGGARPAEDPIAIEPEAGQPARDPAEPEAPMPEGGVPQDKQVSQSAHYDLLPAGE